MITKKDIVQHQLALIKKDCWDQIQNDLHEKNCYVKKDLSKYLTTQELEDQFKQGDEFEASELQAFNEIFELFGKQTPLKWERWINYTNLYEQVTIGRWLNSRQVDSFKSKNESKEREKLRKASLTSEQIQEEKLAKAQAMAARHEQDHKYFERYDEMVMILQPLGLIDWFDPTYIEKMRRHQSEYGKLTKQQSQKLRNIVEGCLNRSYNRYLKNLEKYPDLSPQEVADIQITEQNKKHNCS